MKLKKQIILLCILLASGSPDKFLFSQDSQAKPSRLSSLEAYSSGNYEKAYSEFSELLLTYSKDPLYKYYSGVCLVKLSRDPNEATRLLQDAVMGAGSVRTLPSDGLFYLGRAQQMSGKYSEAAESYNAYVDRVGKKESKVMGVPEFLQQCAQNKGKLADSDLQPVSAKTEPKPVVIKPETKMNPEPEPVATVQKVTTVLPSAKENLPSDYETMLASAVELQFKADSVSAIIENQKKFINGLPETQKNAVKAKMADNEKIAALYQDGADRKYREIDALNHKLDSSMSRNSAPPKQEARVYVDTVKKAEAVKTTPPVKKPEVPKNPMTSTSKQQDIYSLFEVLSQPATDPKAEILMDTQVPPGLVYRIQIGVIRNKISPSYFRGLAPAYGFKVAGTDNTIYYVGMFRKYADAARALITVKSKGFKDAFIAALVDNKRVSSDRSAQLEKEWGSKPLYTELVTQKSKPVVNADTITPTLTFRVEVTRTVKPLKDDVVDGIRKMAGTRGLDIVALEDGRVDYLIGKFITFETASEYSDLLQRNGYRDAQVVAWLGTKEIPLETAKQLFEKLK